MIDILRGMEYTVQAHARIDRQGNLCGWAFCYSGVWTTANLQWNAAFFPRRYGPHGGSRSHGRSRSPPQPVAHAQHRFPAAAGRVPAMDAQCQPEQANPRTCSNSLRPPTSHYRDVSVYSLTVQLQMSNAKTSKAPDPRPVPQTPFAIASYNTSTVLAMPLVQGLCRNPLHVSTCRACK
jgi:hypothetical protein